MPKNCLPCPVEFVEDVFSEDSKVLADTLRRVSGAETPRVLIVADVNVVHHTEGLGAKIGRYFQTHGVEMAAQPVILPGGEKIKADGLQRILSVVGSLVTSRLGAKDVVLALGGGAVLDVAGFAAAIVRGGVPLVRIPTTPAAMIDAALSTHAFADGQTVKDVLAVSAVPAAVLVDKTFAPTVLDGVWKAGFAEALRLAVVRDKSLVKWLAENAAAYARHEVEVLGKMVDDCFALRKKAGGTDFALWSANRLETMSGYKLPHGYAIALGIIIDATYAVAEGLLAEDDRRLLVQALTDSGVMDGAVHSRHLLAQTDKLLDGLELWAIAHGTEEIELMKGLGKSVCEIPDRGAMKAALDLIK